MSIRKAERGRWEDLLIGAFDGEIKVDWSKYKDADEEMDEEERSAGIRGPPVVGNPGLAKAVDEYYQRARTERVQSGGSDPRALASCLPASPMGPSPLIPRRTEPLWPKGTNSL